MADTAITNVVWDDVADNTHVITPTGPLEEMVIIVRSCV